ncbi:uncharacterized protein N7477_007265 [Penicillium maclennaniae]|uniref:uncharacterized protein n=1 Tax=Penicillium maclennaniae TaxID=1343394 RepID=UPI00254019EC|nr:uncharacterized protein N7477_007265 [Penicillium maclennaniae]KAJ5664817.1 hypothetical protein N7477_007265 [Penicillium maclennaniae]
MLASHVAIAAKLEHDDVPNRCWADCGPVVGISEKCDNQYDNNSVELNRICNWSPAKTQVPLCAACITNYKNDGNDHGNDNDNDNDHHNDSDDNDEALEIVHSCSFSATTYNAAIATTLTTTTDTTATDSRSGIATATIRPSSTGSSTNDSTRSDSTGSGGSESSTPTTDSAAGMSMPELLLLQLRV